MQMPGVKQRMGKGVKTFPRYPKLLCVCVIYMVICLLFMTQTAPKPTLLNERKLTSKFIVNAQDEFAEDFVKTKWSNETKHLTGRNRKTSFSSITESHFDEDPHEVFKCDMSHYLRLNKEICDTVLNKGNNSLISNMIKAENSVLKGSNMQALKNLAGSIEFLKDIFKPREDNCNIDKVTKSCDSLRKSYLYGKGDTSAEEELFPLAFAMKIHTSVKQAHRLLRYIYKPHNVYCIHVDKKAPKEIYKMFKRIESCFENIIVIDERINVVYSTIRQVEAELKCMSAVSSAKKTWKYYINLTGQEFMLKTNSEIVKILRLMNGTNDIESYPVPPTEYHKFKQKTFIMNKKPVVTKHRKEPFKHQIKIHKGSAYGLFSRKFVDFILQDNFVQDFLSWLADAYAPEELIWATLQTLPGTPGGRQKVRLGRDSMYISRAVKWQMDKTVTCHGKHVHWICIYGLDDVPWLLSNRNIVANKFYEDYEPLALDCVEKEMYNRLISGGISENFNLDIYRKTLYVN